MKKTKREEAIPSEKLNDKKVDKGRSRKRSKKTKA